MKYLKSTGVVDHLGGMPSSLINSGEQWDLPNAWPPLNHMAIMGLQQTNYPPAQDLALKLAQRWVHANYLAYTKQKQMYEKVKIQTFIISLIHVVSSIRHVPQCPSGTCP